MELRKLLEDPNGGQLLTGYVCLFGLIALGLLIGGNLVLKLLRGEEIDRGTDGLTFIPIVVLGIPAAFKFVRSRHAR